MMGLLKTVIKVAVAAAPVVGVYFVAKKMELINGVQDQEVKNIIEESDSNLETTLEMMKDNNDELIKRAVTGVDSKRRPQIKSAFEEITQSEIYNTQLRFMNYNMWHNERIARNKAYELLGLVSATYIVSVTLLVLFK